MKQSKLITDEVRMVLLPFDTTPNNPVALIKWVAPWLNWTWYPVEFDGDDVLFGLDGSALETGYFNLSEVESLRGPWWARVERDEHFRPTRFSELYAQYI